MKKHFGNPDLTSTLLKRPGSFLFTYFLVFIISYFTLAYFDFLPTSTGGSSPISDLMLLGIISGVLQVLGYVLYIKNPDIDPNPVTWFMFAYGTGILAILEWDTEATIPELFLPISCAVLSIFVSYRCWKQARLKDPTKWWPEDWWPEDKIEQWSFLSDVLITLGYILAWVLATWSLVTLENKEIAVLAFLLLSNISTFPSFYPLLRETYIDPSKENWLPWAIWTVAYMILGVITYLTHGEFWHILMLYPLSNVLLHGLTSVLAARKV